MEFIHTKQHHTQRQQRDRAGASIEGKHQNPLARSAKTPSFRAFLRAPDAGSGTRPTGGSPVKRCLAGKARSRGASPGNAAQTSTDHKMARTGA